MDMYGYVSKHMSSWVRPKIGHILHLVVPISARHFQAKYLAIVSCFLSKFAPRIGKALESCWKNIMTKLEELV